MYGRIQNIKEQILSKNNSEKAKWANDSKFTILQGNMGEDLTGKPELKEPKTGDLVQVDCIPNFFSIHYIFNKEKNVNQLLKNVSTFLKPNGIFIVTTFDGEKIFNALRIKMK